MRGEQTAYDFGAMACPYAVHGMLFVISVRASRARDVRIDEFSRLCQWGCVAHQCPWCGSQDVPVLRRWVAFDAVAMVGKQQPYISGSSSAE
jgi:hypothetical protein